MILTSRTLALKGRGGVGNLGIQAYDVSPCRTFPAGFQLFSI
jgi:hypothetical protein